MEEFLLNKISAVSEEETKILNGEMLDKRLYTGEADFIVDNDKMTHGKRDISVRTHTRYTNFPLHRHNYLEMMIVLSGSITHIISGEEITLTEGDIIVLNKHVSHSIRKTDTPDIGVNIIISDNFAKSLSIELSETVFSELAEQNSRPDGRGIYLCFGTKGKKQITNIIENLLFELTEYSPDMAILRCTTTLLFDYLSRKSGKLLKRASRLPDRDSIRKSTILGYIRSTYRTATLRELSEIMFLTVPYLSKITSELFGKGFKDLLFEERMARATELITKTDIPIGDVIVAVGYENESYFHREFKKRNGLTPLSMRKISKKGK